MSKYKMRKVFRILFLISSMLFIYIALNLDNSNLHRCGHISDLKKINLFWNTILFDMSKILLSTILLLSVILGITYFIVYSRFNFIKTFFSRIVNFRFYLKYKGTNWTRKEVKSLMRKSKFKLKTIIGEVLFLENGSNNEYAIKKTTDSNNREIFIFLANKNIVSKAYDYPSTNRFDDYDRRQYEVINCVNIPDSVSNIISIFKDVAVEQQGPYFYIFLPQGYQNVLTREELNHIRLSFRDYQVDFHTNYICLLSREVRRNQFLYQGTIGGNLY